MMDFVRRLAPSLRRATARAMPALPARFEEPVAASDPFAEVAATASSGPGRERSDVAFATVEPTPAAPSPTEGPRTAPAGTATVGRVRAVQAPPRDDRARPATTGPHRVATEPADVPRPSIRKPDRPDATSASIAASSTGSRTTNPRPIREAALSVRTDPRPDARPVVHVTIDRIDVRAPAPAPRGADRAPRARPGPSVALADYLRGPAADKASR